MNQIKEIFTVSSVSVSGFIRKSHCLGWFATLPEAELAIEQDAGSMIMDGGEFIVVESFGSGIYALGEEIVWYKSEEDKWVKCDAPEWGIRFCNWAMG